MESSTSSVFSRGGTLLPSLYADARCIDAVIVSAHGLPLLPNGEKSTSFLKHGQRPCQPELLLAMPMAAVQARVQARVQPGRNISTGRIISKSTL